VSSMSEWVPTVTHSDIELTSRRLRNYQYSPVGGFLADQSWLGQPTPRRTSPKAA
jgi:hypothetical protein